MHTGPGPWHIHPHLMGDIGGEGHFGPLVGEAQPPEVVFTKGSGPRHPVPGEAPGALSCFPLSTFAFINTLQVQSCDPSQGKEGTAGSLGSGPTSSRGRCSASLSPWSLRCMCVCSCQAPSIQARHRRDLSPPASGGQWKAHSVIQGQATASSLWPRGTGLGT